METDRLDAHESIFFLAPFANLESSPPNLSFELADKFEILTWESVRPDKTRAFHVTQKRTNLDNWMRAGAHPVAVIVADHRASRGLLHTETKTKREMTF
ncbi:hypothetical protein BOTCAL_0197g00060 [Botryotinia calthae]|uniref:Uncharacterized protein n=1 Tax=Botryotinia calthae TaxID=38488 RepID=A0A4Y8CZP5_9HELO|nr:hypothetical protein BOTCAL_0197g00060 [Botryotinia calthae]